MFMHEKGVFIFGIRIVDTERDAISRLPLELSWKIFSYLDNVSLRNAKHSHKTWARIILANRKLRSQLNKFELAVKLGSESLAKFYKRNKRKLKKEMGRNYLPRCEDAGNLGIIIVDLIGQMFGEIGYCWDDHPLGKVGIAARRNDGQVFVKKD